MKLAAAPRRVSRTWSVLALGLLALTDATLAFIHAFTDLFVSDVHTVLAINAFAAMVIMAMRFTAQQIALTRDEKVDLLNDVANQPMRPVERDVVVTIDKVRVKEK